jgi:hypothetical protein
MPTWLGDVFALAALIILAPLLAWLGHRHGRSLRGGIALASLMLGFAVLDPPTKPVIEASQKRDSEEDESGDPPDPDVAPVKPTDG